MDQSNPRRTEIQASQSPTCPNRILDRKIERHALPESFSSNLGWERPSTRRKIPDRSVRAMVNLFEKSAVTSENTPVNRPRQASDTASDRNMIGDDREGDRKHKSNKENKTFKRLEDSQQRGTPQVPLKSPTPSMFPSVRVEYKVDEYSLTLLKHKSYFNNRPLARCLDDNVEEDATTKIQRVKSRRARAVETSAEDRETIEGDDDQKQGNRGIAPPDRNETSSPIHRLDHPMSEIRTWRGISDCSAQKGDRNWDERDPEDVTGFWKSVRTRLWVEEEEIYGERRSLPAEMKSKEVANQGNKSLTLELSTSTSSLPVANHSDPATEVFPPMPTRPPPPVPAAARGRSFSTASSRQPQYSTASSLDEPRPNSSVRLSITMPSCFDIPDPLLDEYPEPRLPTSPPRRRPLPVPPTAPSHSRHPSSGSSGPWTRPPLWRSPSSLRSSSPPPVPPLPTAIPTSAPANQPRPQHRRENHSRNRHPHHSSRPSISTSTFSTHSIAVTDSSATRSVYSCASQTSRRTTPKTSTSSTTTRSMRADSSADSSDFPRPPPAPRRRLTAEEKLREIDALLSGPDDEEMGGWI